MLTTCKLKLYIHTEIRNKYTSLSLSLIKHSDRVVKDIRDFLIVASSILIMSQASYLPHPWVVVKYLS